MFFRLAKVLHTSLSYNFDDMSCGCYVTPINPSSTLRRKNITPKRESLKNRPVKKENHEIYVLSITYLPKKQPQEGWRGGLPWVRKWICLVCCWAQREGRRQNWGSACGGLAPRNVGKKRQFSYWCPWPAEEEQTKVLTSLCAPVGVGEWICQLSTPNKIYLKKIYICMLCSDSIIQRNCRRIYRYCWPWFWVVGDLAMSVVTWFIVIGDLDWDWLLARRT